MNPPTPTTDKKVIYVDASSLKSDSLCDRRYLLHIIRGYTLANRASNYKAGYGTAFHAALEYYYKISPPERGPRMPEVLQKGMDAFAKYAPYVDQDDFRNADHLFKAITKYHERYQRGDSIVPLPNLQESKFCIPWYEDDILIIYLTGTIDLIADYFGRVVIWDHKSTATPAHKIPEFFKAFEMNIQTQLYVWVFKMLSKMDEYVPILINGIFIKRCSKKSEDKGEFDGVAFERTQLIEYTNAQMTQFELWLTDKLNHIKTLALEFICFSQLLGPVNYAACHAGFGLCPFFEVCQLPPNEQYKLLESRYIRDQYNPLTFND